jgi:hypothetical protein
MPLDFSLSIFSYGIRFSMVDADIHTRGIAKHVILSLTASSPH